MSLISITREDYLNQYFDVVYNELLDFIEEINKEQIDLEPYKMFIKKHTMSIPNLRKFQNVEKDMIKEVTNESSIEDKIFFFYELLKYNQNYSTCDLNNEITLEKNRNRTLPALFNLSKFYSPNLSFEEFMLTYIYTIISGISAPDYISSFVCPDIKQLVIRFNKGIISYLFRKYSKTMSYENPPVLRTHLFVSFMCSGILDKNYIHPHFLIKYYQDKLDLSKGNIRKLCDCFLTTFPNLLRVPI